VDCKGSKIRRNAAFSNAKSMICAASAMCPSPQQTTWHRTLLHSAKAGDTAASARSGRRLALG
jgi:hypothetical protein